MGLSQRVAPTRGLGVWQWFRVAVAITVFGLNLMFFMPYVRELAWLANGVEEYFAGTPGLWRPYAVAAGLYVVSSSACIAVPWARTRRRSSVWTLVAVIFWALGVAVLVQFG